MTLALSGRGWLWVSRERETAGATFEVAQHVRFRVAVSVRGTVDVAYAPDDRVATLWFTPQWPDVATRTRRT